MKTADHEQRDGPDPVWTGSGLWAGCDAHRYLSPGVCRVLAIRGGFPAVGVTVSQRLLSPEAGSRRCYRPGPATGGCRSGEARIRGAGRGVAGDHGQMAVLKVATCQFPVGADIGANLRHVKRQMVMASRRGARVAHFPEGSLSGYAGTDFETFVGFDWDRLRDATAEIAEHARQLRLALRTWPA